jgi:hypothetical protein
MYIKTIYDLIEFAKTHPNYTYTNYEGERIVYDENCRRVSDIKINHLMMHSLETIGILDFCGCVMSHRAVRDYKISNIEDFEANVNKIKNVMQHLIKKSKDLKVKSIKHLSEYFKNEYKIIYDKMYIPYSYWGGGKDEQTLYIKELNANTLNSTIFYFPYYYAENLKNKGFYKYIMDFYIKIFNGFDEDFRDYKEYKTNNSFIIKPEYYDLKNKAYEYAYNEILQESNNV